MTRPLIPRPHVRIPAHIAAAATLALRGIDASPATVAGAWAEWEADADGWIGSWRDDMTEADAVREFCAEWEAGDGMI